MEMSVPSFAIPNLLKRLRTSGAVRTTCLVFFDVNKTVEPFQTGLQIDLETSVSSWHREETVAGFLAQEQTTDAVGQNKMTTKSTRPNSIMIASFTVSF